MLAYWAYQRIYSHVFRGSYWTKPVLSVALSTVALDHTDTAAAEPTHTNYGRQTLTTGSWTLADNTVTYGAALTWGNIGTQTIRSVALMDGTWLLAYDNCDYTITDLPYLPEIKFSFASESALACISGETAFCGDDTVTATFTYCGAYGCPDLTWSLDTTETSGSGHKVTGTYLAPGSYTITQIASWCQDTATALTTIYLTQTC